MNSPDVSNKDDGTAANTEYSQKMLEMLYENIQSLLVEIMAVLRKVSVLLFIKKTTKFGMLSNHALCLSWRDGVVTLLSCHL